MSDLFERVLEGEARDVAALLERFAVPFERTATEVGKLRRLREFEVGLEIVEAGDFIAMLVESLRG